MNKNSLTVQIGGREYTLTSSGDEEWTLRVAGYVSRKIDEVTLHTAMSAEIAAVVASLSITEELFHAQEENQKLRNRLYELSREREQNA